MLRILKAGFALVLSGALIAASDAPQDAPVVLVRGLATLAQSMTVLTPVSSNICADISRTQLRQSAVNMKASSHGLMNVRAKEQPG